VATKVSQKKKKKTKNKKKQQPVEFYKFAQTKKFSLNTVEL